MEEVIKNELIAGKSIKEYVKDLAKMNKDMIVKDLNLLDKNDSVLAIRVSIQLLKELNEQSNKNYDEFSKTCNTTIQILQKTLEDKNISEDEKRYNKEMLMKTLDTYAKGHHDKQMADGIKGGIAGGLTALGILGLLWKITKK